MNVDDTGQSQADSAYGIRLANALRGGLVLLAGSTLWGFTSYGQHDAFFDLCFMWLPSAWLVFPAGAVLGYFLPRLVGGRGWVVTLAIGVFAGAIIGLTLAAGSWVVRSHLDLIGLVENRHSGGYASYSMSVRGQLQERAWHMLKGVAPLTGIWIVAWSFWIRYWSRVASLRRMGNENRPERISLGLDRRLLQVVGWVAAGLALFTLAVLLGTAFLQRGAHVPLSSFLAAGFGAVGVVLLGPFLGPMATGWVFDWAWKYATVGVPVLLASLAPFVLFRRPVRAGTAVFAWCGFITGLLFWIAIGVFSLGRCIG